MGGVTVLAIGTISAVLGVLYALMEHDLKRLLAYHSIENIGIILMGFGASLMFRSSAIRCWPRWRSSPGCITPSITPCSRPAVPRRRRVLHATHTRNMEEMGGLIRRMPLDGALFSDRRGRHFRAAAAQRIRERMAHLPVAAAGIRHHAGADPRHVPDQRRAAGADRRAGGGVFREGVRHHLSGATAQRARRSTRRKCPSMRAGMAILALACVLLGLGATWFLPVFDPITRRPSAAACQRGAGGPGMAFC